MWESLHLIIQYVISGIFKDSIYQKYNQTSLREAAVLHKIRFPCKKMIMGYK